MNSTIVNLWHSTCMFDTPSQRNLIAGGHQLAIVTQSAGKEKVKLFRKSLPQTGIRNLLSVKRI